MSILKLLLLISIGITVYTLTYRIYVIIVSRKFKQENFNSIKNRNRIYTKLLQISMTEYKKTVWGIIFALIMYIGGILNYKSKMSAIILSFCGAILSNVIFSILKKLEKQAVLNDLLNVTECMKIQLSAQIPMKICLRNISQICINKNFSQSLANISIQYELDSFDLKRVGQELTNKFKYQEIQIFISALLQQVKSGNANEAFSSLIDKLKEKYIAQIEENTRSKMVLMIFGISIILINIVMLASFPVIMEVNESLSKMLG